MLPASKVCYSARSSVRAIATSKYIEAQDKFMATTYMRPQLVLKRGKGSHVWDVDGKRYIDFTAGIAVTALGHSDPQIADIISSQSNIMLHSSNLYYNDWVGKLSRKLVEVTAACGSMSESSRVFVCNSGTEANEAALKFSRRVGLSQDSTKYEFVAFHGGFHGRTFGALSATANPKYQKPFEPLVPGFKYGNLNDPQSLQLITDRTCGVIVEPIQGEGGVNLADPKWLQSLREACTAKGAVLIFDEIQCGLSRTGKLWAHNFEHYNTQPDILTTAKALGNGFPIAATMITEAVNEKLKIGDHGTTFGGNPLGCRIGVHVLDRITRPELLTNVQMRSQQIINRVSKWTQKFENVIEIRGRGLIIGIQLKCSPEQILQRARSNGLLLITCGTNTLRLVPALNISEEDVDEGMDILEDAIRVVEKS